MRLLLFLLCSVAANLTLTAQNDIAQPIIKQRVYGVAIHYGSILVHTKQVENTKGAKPIGIALEVSTLHTSKEAFTKWGFYNRAGWFFSYFNYHTPILGSVYNAAYFIEPTYKLSNRTELRVRGAFGLGYLTKPNPNLADSSAQANFNYGSHINFSLQVSVSATVHVTNHISGYVSGNFNHNSNAGFAIPNRGVNYPSLSVGVLYHKVTNKLPSYKKEKNDSWRNNNIIKYYGSIFTSAKDGWTGIGIKYNKKLLIGGMVLGSKQVSKVNVLTVGLEAYYDGGLAMTKKAIPDNTSSFFAGILVGNEFLLNRFTLSQQLGFHLYRHTDYYNDVYLHEINPIKNFYQRYGITYQVSKKYKVGFGFLARGDFADFIDVRVLYRFK